jgi:hypothetical protein
MRFDNKSHGEGPHDPSMITETLFMTETLFVQSAQSFRDKKGFRDNPASPAFSKLIEHARAHSAA